MYKILFLVLIGFGNIYAKDIYPVATVEASGIVSDFIEENGLLYVATDAGCIDIIDLTTQKVVRKITIAPLKTAMGEFVPARIHSIDRFEGKTLFTSSGESAYRNVWIDDGVNLKKIVDEKEHIMPKYAYFTSDGKILFGTFGSNIILYDDTEQYALYKHHISQSTIGGMTLSSDRKKMLIADESGTARLIDIKTAQVEHILNSEHVDNIYKVAYSHNIVLTAGQDRRIGVYTLNGSSYHLNSDFLVYCVGLSPSSDIGIYSSGLNHDLQLFDTKTGKKRDKLVGHYATPNKIYFLNESSLVSSGDENRIFFWILNK